MPRAPHEIALAITGERTPLNQTRNFSGAPGGVAPDAPLTWLGRVHYGA
jgi:hypothetical protein